VEVKSDTSGRLDTVNALLAGEVIEEGMNDLLEEADLGMLK